MAERDLDEMLRRISQNRVNRRSFLAASGLVGTSAFLAACSSGASGSSAPSADAGTAAPSADAGSSAPPAGDVENELFVYN
jgi:hypothetical protein